jgi:hypothetical protein
MAAAIANARAVGRLPVHHVTRARVAAAAAASAKDRPGRRKGRGMKKRILAGVLVATACGSNGPALDLGDVSPGGNTFDPGDASTSGLKVTVIAASAEVCAGRCVALEAHASGGSAPYHYAWSQDAAATGASVTVCPRATTTYQVTATDSSGNVGELASVAAMVSDRVTITVSPGCADGGAPPPLDGGPLGPCDTLTGSLDPSGVNPHASWSYGWEPSAGSAFTIYPKFVAPEFDAGAYPASGGFPSIAQWFDPALGVDSISGGQGPVPDLQFNPTAMTVVPLAGNFSGETYSVAPGDVVMIAALVSGQCSVARWTAPGSGAYTAVATFSSPRSSSIPERTDVHVQHNGVDVPSGSASLDANTTSFTVSQTAVVQRGDTIDFVVAPAPMTLTYHAAMVDAKVCAPVDGGHP